MSLLVCFRRAERRFFVIKNHHFIYLQCSADALALQERGDRYMQKLKQIHHHPVIHFFAGTSAMVVTLGIWSMMIFGVQAAANTVVTDLTGGFMRLTQGGDFYAPVLKITVGSNENTKTLAAVTVALAGANGTTPTWTTGTATSSELKDLATTNGGISLWKETNSTAGFQFWGTPDTQVTLAASPVYGASDTFTITPNGSCGATCVLATDGIFYIALKPDTSGVTNNNAFIVTLPANGIATTTAPPTVTVVTTPPIMMDSEPAAIRANGVSGAADSTTVTV